MRIPSDLLTQCFAHGASCYPEEACGVLSGPADEGAEITTFHPIPNRLNEMHEKDPERFPRKAREGYYLDPLAYLKLDKALEAKGQRIRTIFHTHPDVGAYFSDEDKRKAVWEGGALYPGITYLVCGIKDSEPDGAILATFNEGSGEFDIAEVAPSGSA